MNAVVAASLWHRRAYGQDAAFPDTHAFARMLAERFPPREDVDALKKVVLKRAKLPLKPPRRWIDAVKAAG